MGNIKEEAITCESLHEALETARLDVADDLSDMKPRTLAKRDGKVSCKVPCAAAEDGCKRKLELVFTAAKSKIQNPDGRGKITVFDAEKGEETIQINNAACLMGEMK